MYKETDIINIIREILNSNLSDLSKIIAIDIFVNPKKVTESDIKQAQEIATLTNTDYDIIDKIKDVCIIKKGNIDLMYLFKTPNNGNLWICLNTSSFKIDDKGYLELRNYPEYNYSRWYFVKEN
jgi:hypothetical protein